MRAIICLVFIAAAVFLGGWSLMLTVGVVHNEWWPAVPPIGYWSAVQVVLVPTAFGCVSVFASEFFKAVAGDS